MDERDQQRDRQQPRPTPRDPRPDPMDVPPPLGRNGESVFAHFRETQLRYQKVWCKVKYGLDFEKLSERDRQMIAKDYSLAQIDEILECLRRQNWKAHRFTEIQLDREAIVEELVDSLKFSVNQLLLFGVSTAELIRAWDAKTAKVEQRLRDEVGAMVADLGGLIKG